MGVFQEYSETQILQMIGRAGRPQVFLFIFSVLDSKTGYKHMKVFWRVHSRVEKRGQKVDGRGKEGAENRIPKVVISEENMGLSCCCVT